MTKQCEYCGRHFRPDRRVGDRQKACARADCKRRRKLQAQKNWKANHPEIVSRHYEDYVKPWRETRRSARNYFQQSPKRPEMIRDKISPLKDCLELFLRIPEGFGEMIRDEIRLRRIDNSTFAAYGP